MRPGRLRDLVLVLGFAALLPVPLLGMWLWPQTAVLPRAAQAAWPTAFVRDQFPAQMDRAFSSRLGFRRGLVKLHHWVNYVGLGSAPSDDVISGKDGWLFLRQESAVEMFTGEPPFLPGQTAQWISVWEGLGQGIAAWGGQLLVVLVPEKPTIYPEQMPEWLRARRKRTRLDEMVDALGKTRIQFLDLRGPLLEAKQAKEGQLLFSKLDTHWNGHGAVVAAEAILERVARMLGNPKVRLDRRRLVWDLEPEPPDLVSLMALDGWLNEDRPRALLRDPRARWIPWPGAPPVLTARLQRSQLPRFETPDATLPRAVWNRDSFALALVPLVADSFQRSLWVWDQRIHRNVIDGEKPEIVIYETSERHLNVALPTNAYAR